MRRSFDNLAFAYSFLERLSFGKTLMKARLNGLSAVTPSVPQKILLLGDGDGRFSQKILEKNRQATIDSLDNSPAMLRIAEHRISSMGPRASSRFNPIPVNSLEFEFPVSEYDVVVAQFFLDCFPSTIANGLLARIAPSLKAGGSFVYADFAIPQGRRGAWGAQIIVRTLYCLFRLTTDIKAKELPLIEWPRSLSLASRTEALRGLVSSEIRIKAP